jgi:hypothetical protein
MQNYQKKDSSMVAEAARDKKKNAIYFLER